jgi:hypothetical protein
LRTFESDWKRRHDSLQWQLTETEQKMVSLNFLPKLGLSQENFLLKSYFAKYINENNHKKYVKLIAMKKNGYF